jgi:hemolysin D
MIAWMRSVADGWRAWADLWARHAAVARDAWHRRDALQGPRRSTDELAFLPAALQLQQTPVHPAPRFAAGLLILLIALALLWACLSEVDVVAVATGRIIVGQRTKTIQPLERSVVQRVLVSDGDRVEAGQALVELDPTMAYADRRNVGEQLKAAQSEWLRSRWLLQALQAPEPQPQGSLSPLLQRAPLAADAVDAASDWRADEWQTLQDQLATEWRDIQARLARSDAEMRRRRAEMATGREVLAKLVSTLPLVRKREQDLLALVAQGFVAPHAGQDRTRERIEMERDLETQHARLQEADAALAESVTGKSAYVAETRRQLAERMAQAGLRLQQARQEHAKAVQREKLTVLTSPVAGTVQQLAAHTVGGVVTEAQVLMVIVPDDFEKGEVIAEVVLENKDIGFVRSGQSAEVKLETFLFTRYGTIPARVQQVSADAVNDEQRGAIFPARLQLGRKTIGVDGRQIRLSPGMNLSAEIKTGHRRVIEYLLSPIQKAGGESLRER